MKQSERDHNDPFQERTANWADFFMVMNGFVSDMRRLFVSGEWDGGRSRATVPTGGFMFLRLLVFCCVWVVMRGVLCLVV